MGTFLNLIYGIAILVSLPWLIIRGIRTGRYRAGWKQKLLGLVPETVDTQRVIWLHAVSVGEVQLLSTLVAGLELRKPNCKLCISTTTRAGMELAEKTFAKHSVFYFPLDFTWAVRTAIVRLKPSLLVLVELEVWPNLIREAKRVQCAVVIVNGRLSESSFDRYTQFRWLIKSSFEKLDLVAVQDAVYAERFRSMGVRQGRILQAGNLKFDGACNDRSHREVLSRKAQLCISEEHRVWVVGSTQAPEEEYAIEAFQKIHTCFPKCKLIIVPRQPDRFDEVATLLEKTAFRVIRRSKLPKVSENDWEIMLGDTLGELRWWWGLADFAFVGGSFGDRGGQNMIEPAAFGVSTAVGPNTKNFADTVRILLEAKALIQLQQPEDLFDWALANVSSAEHRAQMGKRASEIASAHRGALDRTLDALEPWMEKDS